MNTEDRNHARIYNRQMLTKTYDRTNFFAGAYRMPRIEIEQPNVIQSIFFIVCGALAAVILAADLFL